MVHNAYLVHWAERGVIGVVVFLGLHVVHLWVGLRRRFWRDPVLAALGWGISASLVGLVINYNFDHFYLDSRPGVLWPMLGLLTALMRLGSAPGTTPRRRAREYREVSHSDRPVLQAAGPSR